MDVCIQVYIMVFLNFSIHSTFLLIEFLSFAREVSK